MYTLLSLQRGLGQRVLTARRKCPINRQVGPRERPGFRLVASLAERLSQEVERTRLPASAETIASSTLVLINLRWSDRSIMTQLQLRDLAHSLYTCSPINAAASYARSNKSHKSNQLD